MRDLKREGEEIEVAGWLVQGFRHADGTYFERMREEGRPVQKWYRGVHEA